MKRPVEEGENTCISLKVTAKVDVRVNAWLTFSELIKLSCDTFPAARAPAVLRCSAIAPGVSAEQLVSQRRQE